ncbi:MAG: ACT domain-containing protein [Rikenellaceae bacterium]|jgi:hypothetical protein|nr:ACT domain-containing protein [Rikenellaceae bacterium]
MIAKQLSVFLENKTGRINEVTRILGTAGINMTAFSIAETTDFGILRVIVSDIDKAVAVLRENHYTVRLTDVVCLDCPNVPGALSEVLEHLAGENVFIEYMYAFSRGEIASVVIRPTDIARCVAILEKYLLG